MKRLLVLLTLGLVVFIAVNRQRVFLRDPIAKVMRDGVVQGETKVMINSTNDVLVGELSESHGRIYLVQHWNKLPAIPTAPLRCINGVACMTDADHASATAIVAGSRGSRESVEGTTMTDRQVRFVDEMGALVEVDLR